MLELHMAELGPQNEQVYANFELNLAETRTRKTLLVSRPIHIQIETTTRCNLGCIQCGLHSYALKNRDLDVEVLLDLAKKLFPTAGSVVFSDTGEALMYSWLDTVFELVRQYKIPVAGFFTNGTLLDDKAVAAILASGMAFVNVSIDGATPETYERIRLGARFSEVMGNLRRLTDQRRKKGSRFPIVQVNFVGMRENIEEFPRLVEMVADAGAERVVCSNLVPYTYELQERSLVHQSEVTARVRRRALEIGEALDVYVGFPEPGLPAMKRSSHGTKPQIFDPGARLSPSHAVASLEVNEVPDHAIRAEFLQLHVLVKNLSQTLFRGTGDPVLGRVALSYHWEDEQGETVVFDGLRSELGGDLEAGESKRVLCTVRTPEKAGNYRLVLDLVREGVRWFGDLCQRPVSQMEIAEAFALNYFPPPLGRCEYPWKYFTVKVSGDIYPCCWLSKSLGNVREQSIEEIWNGERFQRLRASICDGSYSVCRGAHCPYSSLTPPDAFRMEFEPQEVLDKMLLGRESRLEVRVWNRSPFVYRAFGDDFDGAVRLAYHWRSQKGKTLVFDGLRTPLPHDLEPGGAATVSMRIAPPARAGKHRLLLDAVIEGATWFSQAGMKPVELEVDVRCSTA